MRDGDEVIALGHPLGLDFTVTSGIVSSRRRTFKGYDFIQTDAAINPGNSGGPLIDKAGHLIGLNTISTREAQGISLAIPIERIKQVAGQALAGKGESEEVCSGCPQIIRPTDAYCPNCGKEIKRSPDPEPQPPPSMEVRRIVDEIVNSCAQEFDTVRRCDDNTWLLISGSASTIVLFHENKNDVDSSMVIVACKITRVPRDNIIRFYRKALEWNFRGGLYCHLAIAETDELFLQSRRMLKDITPSELTRMILDVAGMADALDGEFVDEFA